MIAVALLGGCGLMNVADRMNEAFDIFERSVAAARESPVGQGVVAGAAEAGKAVADGISALEATGIGGMVATVALGLLKASGAAWKAASNSAKQKRLEEIAKGVEQANGKSAK